MLEKLRNSFTYENCVFEPVSEKIDKNFDCGHHDLNEFFHKDLLSHELHLLAKTYSFKLQGPEGTFLLALVSFCNDAIKIESLGKRIKLPHRHRHDFVPAVKIARIGVQKERCRRGTGSTILHLAKTFFTLENRTGCRIVTVDAYNEQPVLNFYKKNLFDFLTSEDAAKPTRIMWYDLRTTKEESIQEFASKIQPI